jgi:hypothetical protein
MTRVILLEQLKEFTEVVVHDLRLPVRPEEESDELPILRPPSVYRMHLPEFGDAMRKAPYVLHQVVIGKDSQTSGRALPDATTVVRTVFCVYHEDCQEGALALLNLMEQLRIALLEQAVLGGQFALDLKAGVEMLAYPDDGDVSIAPYYLGEMISTWHIPPVKRFASDRVIHGMPPCDPYPRYPGGFPEATTVLLRKEDKNGEETH